MKSKVFKLVALLLGLILMLTGIGVVLYPFVSDYWNSVHMASLIAGYSDILDEMSDEDYENLLAAVEDYNNSLVSDPLRFEPSEERHKLYESLLDVQGTGIIGYISIPQIYVRLPIYHGTSDDVLQVAIGHVEGSSLPIGGESTHVVVSGHNGISAATLFTYLNKLEIGDTFTINVLNDILTYQVEAINVVLPSESELLKIQPGRDLVTLVTCTPYGVNTHRLLVTASRIPTPEDYEEYKPQSPLDYIIPQEGLPDFEKYIVLGSVGFIILCLVIIVIILLVKRRRRR